ncbi:MAG: tetratricopeptide repeat protein [Gammaproteobacteria bacterium]|nr:tetratricopeptide repeat protein [Gammaproteobacteria bacterium]
MRQWLLRGLFFVFFAPQSLLADQTDPALPTLFEELKTAETATQSALVESQIWQHWLSAPDDNANALMSQVVGAMQSGQLILALKLSDQLVDSSPNFSEAWNKRATIHYLMGNPDASVADIQKTLALEPRHFGAISGLGLIFHQKGDFDSALAAFEEVLEIAPQSQNAQMSVERVKRDMRSEI